MASTHTSSYDRIHAILNGTISAAAKKESMDEHLKLVAMIESDRHLIVGAKALAAYMKQRFTEDTDYVVGHTSFQKVRGWLRRENIPHDDQGEAIRSEALAIDVIDASRNPVLAEILRRENGIPSREALAATKYISIVSGTPGQQKLHFDIGDFIGIVSLEGFDIETFLGYLVDRHEEQRPHAGDMIDRIQRGESPITI